MLFREKPLRINNLITETRETKLMLYCNRKCITGEVAITVIQVKS